MIKEIRITDVALILLKATIVKTCTIMTNIHEVLYFLLCTKFINFISNYKFSI